MLSQVLSRRPSGRVAAKGGGAAAVDGRGGTVAGGSAAGCGGGRTGPSSRLLRDCVGGGAHLQTTCLGR